MQTWVNGRLRLRVWAKLILGAMTWIWLVASALAHASLTATMPQDSEIVDVAPAYFSLAFSEPVSPLALKLVRPDGSSVALDRFALKDRTVEIEAPAGLGRGTHVLSWRVISEDGHPVGGSVIFSIGEASAEPPVVEDEIDWTLRGGLWATKAALYLGLFIGVGGAFAMAWLTPATVAGRGIAAACLGVGVIGAILSIGFQGLDALGARPVRILEPVIWSTGMATSLGLTIVAAVAAFGFAGVGLLDRRWLSRAAAFAALFLSGTALSLSGHAAAADPQWLTRPMVFVHGAAIAFWTGALMPLGVSLWRRGPDGLAGLKRFSTCIPYVVAALAIAGLVLAVIQVETPRALFDTTYGQILLVKLVLLVGLFGLAAVNRWTLTAPVAAGDAAATRRLIRSVAAETAIVLLIFGVAACWRFTPPPRALAIAAAEPATEYIHTDKALAFIKVMPGRAGEADVSVNILTGEFHVLDAKEVTLVLSKPNAGIEPFKRAAVRRGEANWRIDGLTIPLAGTWRVRVDILISDFEMVRLEGQIRIRP